MNNDLISREALKKAIEEAFEKANLSEYEACVCVCEIYDKQIDNAPTVAPDKIQAIMSDYLVYRCEPQRPQGEWIPVSERLPEALQSVLVTSKSGRVYTSYIAHGDWEYGGDVIAWQPLPEPYKKDGAENDR